MDFCAERGPLVFSMGLPRRIMPPCCFLSRHGGKRSGEYPVLLHRIAVSVDFVHLAQIQFADAGFDLTHVADDHPDEMAG